MEEIFRKKSLDKVKSPENLDDYIRVANPGVWLLLISAIILLVGACIWGVFGHVDSVADSVIRVENGRAVCYIAEENITSVKEGMTVKFDDAEAVIDEIGEKGERGYPCALAGEVSCPDGFYEGKVIIGNFKPLSFVLN